MGEKKITEKPTEEEKSEIKKKELQRHVGVDSSDTTHLTVRLREKHGAV